MARLLRVELDLLAQLQHVGVDGAGGRELIFAPDGVQQAGAVERLLARLTDRHQKNYSSNADDTLVVSAEPACWVGAACTAADLAMLRRHVPRHFAASGAHVYTMGDPEYYYEAAAVEEE